MNLQELIDKQSELDQHILEEHPELKDQDNTDWKTLALHVELGECANEWRGFKKWSKNQEPRTMKSSIGFSNPGGAFQYTTNPLLEEYVDCLHFFISIAIEKGWQESLWIYEDAIMDIEEEGFDGGITGAFLEVNYMLSKSYMEKKPIEHLEEKLGMTTPQFYFKSAWFVFMAIGLVGFKFTWEQIYQAYMVKNKVNHERQESGY